MMKQISLNSLRTLAYSHLFLSLCPAALIVSTYLIMDNSFQRVSFELLCFVFCSSLFIYNLNVLSISSGSNVASERGSWIYLHKKELRTLLFLSALGTVFFSSFISMRSLIFVLHLCVLSVLYVYPIKIGERTFSLRKIPFVKIFILTYVWTSVTVILPCIESGVDFNLKAMLLLFERFLFIFVLALLFDIRDIDLDRKANLITIPGLLGIKYAANLQKLLVVAFVLLTLIYEGLNYITAGRMVLAAFTLLLFQKVKKEKQSDLFYMFGIDGLMILQFVVLILLWTFLK